MPKRPAFQFYPSDWLNDLGLRQCSPTARGVWLDMMCFMHEGQPYGHLSTISGELTVPWLANRIGIRKGVLLSCIEELQKFNVFSRNSCGIIYSRRMVRDEQLREKRAENGPLSASNINVPRSKKDTILDGGDGPPEGPHAAPSPSSSSSSSSSKNKEQEREAQAPPAPKAEPIDSERVKRATLFTLTEMPEEWAAFALKKRGWDKAQTQSVFEAFSYHWNAKSGRDATKRNWYAAWCGWVIRERDPPKGIQPGLFRQPSHTDRAIQLANQRVEKGERPFG